MTRHLHAGPLGGYDGVEMWTVRAWSATSAQARVVASLHERLHHELQNTTLWGLLTRFCDDFRRAGVSVATTHAIFWIGVMRSQRVHETYATTLATGVDEPYIALLADNPEYAEHRARGLALLGTSAAEWEAHRHLIDALLRSCMLARPLGDLVDDFPEIPIAHFDAPDLRPDERLALLPGADLSALREPGIPPPQDVDELNALHDRVAAHLDAHGLPTLSTAEYRDAVRRLIARVGARLPQLTIEIDETRHDVVEDTLEELQRERIELHEAPLPVETFPLPEAGARAADLLRRHDEVGAHVLAVWGRGDLLARQFARPNPFEQVDGHALGLQAAGRDDAGEPVVRFALAEGIADVAQLAAGMREIEVLFLTTQASVLDAPDDVRFSGDRPVHVLVDQPILEQLRHTLAQDARIRWTRLQLSGDRALSLFAFTVDALPHVTYLHFASEVGAHALATWLRAAPADAVTDDDAGLSPADLARVEAVAQHVVAAWWRLDQIGARRA